MYVALRGVEMSKLRVAERVSHGGHNISVADIERRFPRSLLQDFSHRVNQCTCLMNDGENPELVFEQHANDRNMVHHDYYELLLKEAER